MLHSQTCSNIYLCENTTYGETHTPADKDQRAV